MPRLHPLLILSCIAACTVDPDQGGTLAGDASSAGAPDDSDNTDDTDGPMDSEEGDDAPGTDDGEDGESDDGENPGTIFDVSLPEDVLAPCQAIDLLFVIDDSGSMGNEQTSLVNSFPGFIDTIQTELVAPQGYHLGVVTTDPYEWNAPSCQSLGALVTQTGGNLSSDSTCGPYAEGQRYMTDADNLATSFGCAAKVGVQGLGLERPMDALIEAVSSDMNAEEECNSGFLRDEAILVIVLITDEEDKDDSMGDPADWYEAVVDAKGGSDEDIVVVSLIGHPKPNDCPPWQWTGMDGAQISHRLIEWTQSFSHGIVGDICSETYDSIFEEAVAGITEACTSAVPAD